MPHITLCYCALSAARTCTDADRDPIEVAQERAKARGRYVVLAVNDIVPNLTWEPTTSKACCGRQNRSTAVAGPRAIGTAAWLG